MFEKSRVTLSRVWFDFEITNDPNSNAFLHEPVDIAKIFPSADPARWDALRKECEAINKSRLRAFSRSKWVNCQVRACALVGLESPDATVSLTIKSRWETDTNTDPYLDILKESLSLSLANLRSTLGDFGSVDLAHFDRMSKRERLQMSHAKATQLAIRHHPRPDIVSSPVRASLRGTRVLI